MWWPSCGHLVDPVRSGPEDRHGVADFASFDAGLDRIYDVADHDGFLLGPEQDEDPEPWMSAEAHPQTES